MIGKKKLNIFFFKVVGTTETYTLAYTTLFRSLTTQLFTTLRTDYNGKRPSHFSPPHPPAYFAGAALQNGPLVWSGVLAKKKGGDPVKDACLGQSR